MKRRALSQTPMVAMPPEADVGNSQGRGGWANSLPDHVVDYLKNRLMSLDHIKDLYSTKTEKARMIADTGIDLKAF